MNLRELHTTISNRLIALNGTSTEYLEPYEEGHHDGHVDATEQCIEWVNRTQPELAPGLINHLSQVQGEMDPERMAIIFPRNPHHFWEKYVSVNRNILSFWTGLDSENKQKVVDYINGGVTL